MGCPVQQKAKERKRQAYSYRVVGENSEKEMGKDVQTRRRKREKQASRTSAVAATHIIASSPVKRRADRVCVAAALLLLLRKLSLEHKKNSMNEEHARNRPKRIYRSRFKQMREMQERLLVASKCRGTTHNCRRTYAREGREVKSSSTEEESIVKQTRRESSNAKPVDDGHTYTRTGTHEHAGLAS